jgi:hypothetical protein
MRKKGENWDCFFGATTFSTTTFSTATLSILNLIEALIKKGSQLGCNQGILKGAV